MRRETKSKAVIWLGCALFASFCALSVVFAQQEPASPLGPLSTRTGLLLTDETTLKLIHNSSGDLAHHYVSQLCQWQRVEASDEYEKAAQWMLSKTKEFGLEDAHIERFPSDGATRYFGFQSKRFWRVRKAELWMESPSKLRITSYAELPISLCRDSTSATAEAELVDIGAGMSDADYGTGVRGKIVLTSSDPLLVLDRAVYKGGALGIVSYWTIPEWDRLNRLPGDYPRLVGWRYLSDPGPDRHGTFAFMISPERAQELHEMMRTAPIRLRAIVDADLIAGDLGVVTAVIRGSKYPDEEVMVSAHLDEIGADDNASGSASNLEMARTLKYLIDTRQMPCPLRTIRFIWGPEFAASYVWFSKHLNDPIRRIADLNFDQVGGDLTKLNAVYMVSYTPDSMPSFLNSVMQSIVNFMNKYNNVRYPVQKDFQIISVTGTRDRMQAIMIPFIRGSDSEVYNQLNIPAVFSVILPENFYHSSQDTPDKEDPTQLHRSIFSGLAAMTTIAYGEDKDAVHIAELAFLGARDRIAADQERASSLILTSTPGNLGENVRWARMIVRHSYRRETAAIRSASGFAETPPSRQAVEKVAQLLQAEEDGALRHFDELASMKAARLGVTPEQVVPSAEERKADRLVPRWNKGRELLGSGYVFGNAAADSSLHLDRVREAIAQAEKTMNAQGEDPLRVMGFADAAAYYANGQRSMLEIHDSIAAEFTPLPLDVIELYFRAFEKAGVMTIEER
jgi:hypothetical protein